MTITEPGVASAMLQPHPDTTEPTLDPETIAEINGIGEGPRALCRPSSDEVVKAIVTECHAKGVTCTERQARRIIGFMCYLTGERRRARYTEWERHLTDREIARFHAQLDVVMPDDTASTPGSAHALLERHALGNEAAKRQLVHTKSGSVARDCTVWVSVRPAA